MIKTLAARWAVTMELRRARAARRREYGGPECYRLVWGGAR